MRRMRALRRTLGLKAVVTWVNPHEPAPSPEQRLQEARLLALHVMTVEKINRDPGLLEIVQRNFERWQERGLRLRGTAPIFGVLNARERQRIRAAFRLMPDRFP